MTDNDFETADVNETVELTANTQLNAYEIGWDEFVGADRDVDNISVNTEVDDTEVIVEVTGDVTKRDPKEIPVFQSQERWEGRSDTDPTPTPVWRKVAAKAVSPVITGGMLAGSSVITVRIMEQLDLTINGTPVTPPGVPELFAVIALIVFVSMAIQYLPRKLGAVSA